MFLQQLQFTVTPAPTQKALRQLKPLDITSDAIPNAKVPPKALQIDPVAITAGYFV
ncbi:MAG: hypothetical protein ACEY3C_07800 [Candidatus Tisiphia sp.]